MLRAPGSLTSGEIEAVRLVGPSAPATNRGRSGVVAVTASATARGRAEGVGFGDVGAGLEVGPVDRRDRVRLGQRQQVVVALDVLGPVREAAAAVAGFVEAKPLDHCPHGPVKDEDPLCRRGPERGQPFVAGHGLRLPRGSDHPHGSQADDRSIH